MLVAFASGLGRPGRAGCWGLGLEAPPGRALARLMRSGFHFRWERPSGGQAVLGCAPGFSRDLTAGLEKRGVLGVRPSPRNPSYYAHSTWAERTDERYMSPWIAEQRGCHWERVPVVFACVARHPIPATLRTTANKWSTVGAKYGMSHPPLPSAVIPAFCALSRPSTLSRWVTRIRTLQNAPNAIGIVSKSNGGRRPYGRVRTSRKGHRGVHGSRLKHQDCRVNAECFRGIAASYVDRVPARIAGYEEGRRDPSRHTPSSRNVLRYTQNRPRSDGDWANVVISTFLSAGNMGEFSQLALAHRLLIHGKSRSRTAKAHPRHRPYRALSSDAGRRLLSGLLTAHITVEGMASKLNITGALVFLLRRGKKRGIPRGCSLCGGNAVLATSNASFSDGFPAHASPRRQISLPLRARREGRRSPSTLSWAVSRREGLLRTMHKPIVFLIGAFSCIGVSYVHIRVDKTRRGVRWRGRQEAKTRRINGWTSGREAYSSRFDRRLFAGRTSRLPSEDRTACSRELDFAQRIVSSSFSYPGRPILYIHRRSTGTIGRASR
ncbi:hypothetical protein OF83DRAFT_1292398 [Amylostereum chailletii]|nr:hypothetical protein OF83DRAFT_1292398 [Amylostereum chailletii]